MRHIQLGLACLLAGLFTSGCGTLGWGTKTDAQRVEGLCRIASFVGASTYLTRNPGDIPAFELVRNGVTALLAAETVNPAALREALALLPLGELRADQAAILVTTAVLMLEEAGVADPIQEPLARAAAVGIRDGLGLAIQIAKPVTLEK